MEKFINDYLSKLKENNVNVDSVVLEQDGKIKEVVINDIDLHELRSCSKLLIAFAYGIAINEEMICKTSGEVLSLETSVYDTFSKVCNYRLDEKIKKWTIRTLLTHSTGYSKMMYSAKEISEQCINTNDLVFEILKTNIDNKPNQKFVYNNAEPYLLSVFFYENFGFNISDFIAERIFKPLNINDYRWDNYGKYCAAATGLYLSYNDFHKVGQLLYFYGMYNNIQIVPKSWVEQMISKQVDCVDYYKPERVLPKTGAGYFVWLSKDGIIFRDGSMGQYIICDHKNNRLLTIMSAEKRMNLITECLKDLL